MQAYLQQDSNSSIMQQYAKHSFVLEGRISSTEVGDFIVLFLVICQHLAIELHVSLENIGEELNNSICLCWFMEETVVKWELQERIQHLGKR